jgi:hypothetical protein
MRADGLWHIGPLDADERRVDMKTKVFLGSLTIAILSAGCATQAYQAYPGPQLPRDKTAGIAAADAPIISIDGTAIPAGRAVMLRAGVHAVSATGIDANGRNIGLMTLCLAAEGGANYRVRLGGIARDLPEVYDPNRDSVVRTLSLTVGQDCAPGPLPGTVVAVALPSGARAHRGVPPHDPRDDPHLVIDWGGWLMLPVAMLRALLALGLGA